ncbi:type II toxin-antitoxin system VapC family toxin [Synechococcus sp. CBW1107]|jgi:predicted nucleic acid-binding protein|uniref:type II toxin-antitoxin system VapC family toxin n=1 Tax=unclassified Synechococcus TaxID=2626047 RepID=UPI0018CE5B08|nr:MULTISPECIES: type II toxin-antitoxin system VapC family toxin [unclassified Synechococcus]QPN58217.1 type II toxin-antitoxin system VapC family toxin [Synechococcus sp. CBW1107]QPN61056.1 type II toxin-antitoxin system VapC family toxin [Synechococcus sp. CBW1002]QPN67275.1 type II toxin-antitoxin system VapC family toxin [Synechococcus sp. CBW1006]
MIYLDTSVVVALLTPEERSAQALDWFAESRDFLISSDWLITETHSALGIKQRHHGLSSEVRQAAGEQFERLLQGGVELRSLDRDRFHQSVASRSRCTHLPSFDSWMQQAAAALGMMSALE